MDIDLIIDTIQRILFCITLVVILGYFIGLVKTTVFDIRSEGGKYTEMSHVIPLLSFVFLIPFLIAISISIDDASRAFAQRFLSHGNYINEMLMVRGVITVTIMTAFSIFIWAFCRSFFIISLLDGGVWSKSELFSSVLSASSKRERYSEAFFRGLIVLFFLNHQIVIADALGAHLTEFFGMERNGCDFARVAWTAGRDHLATLPHWLTGNPVFCGLTKPISNSYNEIISPQSSGGNAYSGQFPSIATQIRIVSISSLFVLASIMLWSFRTSNLYAKYCGEQGPLERCERSKREFNVQRRACGYAAVSSLFMAAITSGVAGQAGGQFMAYLISLIALIVIWYAMRFLFIVLAQIIGVFAWNFYWVSVRDGIRRRWARLWFPPKDKS